MVKLFVPGVTSTSPKQPTTFGCARCLGPRDEGKVPEPHRFYDNLWHVPSDSFKRNGLVYEVELGDIDRCTCPHGSHLDTTQAATCKHVRRAKQIIISITPFELFEEPEDDGDAGDEHKPMCPDCLLPMFVLIDCKDPLYRCSECGMELYESNFKPQPPSGKKPFGLEDLFTDQGPVVYAPARKAY